MLCCAVGAGDSLLLLLGDSVESKGRISFPRLLFCVRVEVFFQDKAKMERCGSALLSLFSSFLGARGGCGCTMRRGISFFKEKKKGGKACLYQWRGIDLVGDECGQGYRGWMARSLPGWSAYTDLPLCRGSERVCTRQPSSPLHGAG